ncbi:TadE-like protein [Rubripirellula lacrimiformis]|uniref:TadE-like protein n=1 Tax=Rubripirellula lacrimiformis TaxID=1930273 RepID=A0A517NHP9_9BACT|nr:TadE/TadG family type IV pilus assembly protein [Rubripirellula lacrimiformis]QDT06667.1 TadE-like protein [Rubripirellula lacrimiformis]
MKRHNQSRPIRRRRRCGQSRLGASAVEFAIIANILLLIILTCMEFARMNMVRNLAQDAAYYAARHAIVPGATSAEAEGEANRIMGSLLTNGYSVAVSELDSESTNVTVTVTVDLGEVAMFAPFFLPESDISSTVRMRTERYDGFYEQ